MTSETPQGYRNEFDADDKAAHYDASEYGSGSWSSLVWDRERTILEDMLDRRLFVPRRERYLDFACGTGRVTAAVAPHFTEVVGADISAAMVARAKARLPQAEFVVGDVLADHELAGADFDLITCFRFVLNAEPGDRQPVLAWLASRLRDGDSRLVVNNHGHLMSHKAISHGLRRLRGGGAATTGNVLGERTLLSLFDAAGLEVVDRVGTGFGGGQLARRLPAGVTERIQTALTGAPVVDRLGEDQLYVLRRR